MSDSLQPHELQDAAPWKKSYDKPRQHFAASLSFTISSSLLKLMSIDLVMPSNHLILCCPLILLPSIFPSMRVFSTELVLHIRWPNITASASVLPMSIQGWFPYLLAVQGTLRSLLQHHNSKASILRHLAFFMVQLAHPYITRKTIGLFIWTFVGKVMSLLFNTLSRFVIAFLQEVIIF